jgi:rRNA maturation protein Rpf1
MKVVKDSYISINFYFVENIQSQMTQTLIKYFKGELMYFRRGSTVPYIFDICG